MEEDTFLRTWRRLSFNLPIYQILYHVELPEDNNRKNYFVVNANG